MPTIQNLLGSSFLFASLVGGIAAVHDVSQSHSSIQEAVVTAGGAHMISYRGHGPTEEEKRAEREAASQRILERRQLFREEVEAFQAESEITGEEKGPSQQFRDLALRPGSNSKLTKITAEELEKSHDTLRRRLGNYNPYQQPSLADVSEDYDYWQQAYRMLGGFIDCDHPVGGNSHDSGDKDGDGGDGEACGRWMMWAAYVDPNYQGYGRDEYFSDDPIGTMDCHNPDTDWELLGVYRQEFYQFIEQISKHLWAIDDYEYITAVSGLAYMTDSDCRYVGSGYVNGGEVSVYAGVAPQEDGYFRMALYTDAACIFPSDDDLGMTYDYFDLYQDAENDDGSEYWSAAQEYTLTNLNGVYEEFKYCTPCMDYPTYQDGYFIGDYGTDEGDMINQCWKFHSHDSYFCGADCVELGHKQGTIVSVVYGDTLFGKVLDDYYYTTTGSSLTDEESEGKAKHQPESKMSKLKANTFITFSGIVFVATFLAFAVARRSSRSEKASSRTRRLLEDHVSGGTGSRKSRSSKSRSASRSASQLAESSARRSKSRTASRGPDSRRSKSKSRRSSSDYQPPPARSPTNASEGGDGGEVQPVGSYSDRRLKKPSSKRRQDADYF